MSRPRFLKLRRDLWQARGRVALMVVAVAVALSGVGAMLVARAVVARESAVAYTGTNPASATLDVAGGVDAALLARVRQRPGVADAAARQAITTRVRVDGKWLRMLLFVVAPDDPLRIARFAVESGTWPPAADGVLIERAATGVLGASPGSTLEIAAAAGGTTSVRIAGTVHDPAQAPAAQERTGYGYLTPAAATRLGYTPAPDQLKIIVGDPAGGRELRQPEVDRVAGEVAAWLATTGYPVHRVSAPPYRHPHQNQTNTVTALFLAFALAALALAGVLMATTLGAMLAAQTRQIGAMKAVGATTAQLLGMYLTVTVGIAVTATALAIGPALLAGYGLADLVAGLLNIDLTSRAIPGWVFLTVAGTGIGIPVLVALVPLVRAARLTVRAALDDHGAGASVGTRRTDRWLARVRGGNRTTVLAVRNMLRRRTRLVLTLALLAAGGALFTTGLNTAAAWQAWVDDGLAKRSYGAELQLAEAAPAAGLAAAGSGIDGITAIETIVTLPASPATSSGQVEVERTYPDGGHGRFNLTALPPDTDMVHFDVLAGRWLRTGDTDAVVLNQAAATRLGDPAVGDQVRLAVEGKHTVWRVAGVVAEVGGPATAYVAARAADALTGTPGLATGLRIRTAADVSAVTSRAEAALAAAGFPVAATTPTTELRTAIDEHVVIFIYTLVALAVVMAVVGVLGLASAMSIAVTERTREHGIMQAIGASPATIRRLVLTEGLLTGLVGCLIAVVLGLPGSVAVGGLLGRISFGLPLPLHPSYPGLLAWIVLALAGAAAATATAARRAARLTIPQTLAHQ
jgi:putative ABC transport system permease protein